MRPRPGAHSSPTALEARKLALQREYEQLQLRSAAEHGPAAGDVRQVARAEQPPPPRMHNGAQADNLPSDRQFFLNERVRAAPDGRPRPAS